MNPCRNCRHSLLDHDIAPRDDLPVPGGEGNCMREWCTCKYYVSEEEKMTEERNTVPVEEVKKEITPEQLQALFEASIQLMDSAIKDLVTAWKGIGIVLMSSQIVPPKEEVNGDSPTDQAQS